MIAIQSTILRDLQFTMRYGEKMDKLLAFRVVQWCGNTKVYHNHMKNQKSFENECPEGSERWREVSQLQVGMMYSWDMGSMVLLSWDI